MGYLAFDLGGSSGKLFFGTFDGTRFSLRTIHRFSNATVPLAGGLYWDFIGIWQHLCHGLQKADSEGGVHSLGIDTFCNDFAFIHASGELLSPVRCYRDERSIRNADAIYEKMSRRQLYAATGNQLASFNTLMQLASMRVEGTDAVLDTAHRLLFLPDLLAFYITGEILAERTVSSVSQMYDFHTGDWSDSILQTFNIPRGLFGPLTDSGTVSGKASTGFRRNWGVDGFDFVSVCQHDTASAFLALPGNCDRAIISIGTWALVGCENEMPIINDFGFEHNIANEGSLPGHHRLLRNVMGTWLIQEVRADYLREGVHLDFAEMVSMAQEAEPFAALVNVDDPAFFSPGQMREKIRMKCWTPSGAKPETPGQFVRCICESLALKYRWSVEALETLTNRRFPIVSAIGGGSQDAMTCQMTANACNKPVEAGPADASALGNILCQMIACGELRDVFQGRELVAESFPPVRYEPKDAVQWEDVYQAFKKHFVI